MDPTLLQQQPPFNFSLSSESKYLGSQDRPFSNSSYSTNDYSYSSRRPQTSLANGVSATGVALPANSTLDFHGTSLLNENTPFHSNSQLLLSPPDSTTGSGGPSGHPSSTLHYSTTLPKPLTSNAGAADHYSSAPPSILSSNWPGPSMTSMDRSRFPPQPLSPPLGYNTASGIAGLLANRPVVDRLSHSYHSTGQPISAGIFQHAQSNRYSPAGYHRNSISQTFSMGEPSYASHSVALPFPEVSAASRVEGPAFGDTNVLHHVLGGHSHHLLPEISASIQKGFFQVDRKWTCYRRNYFTVHCSFSLKGQFAEGPYYLEKPAQRELIHGFAVSISARTAAQNNGESEARGLVQHTPKRDKATESVPGRHSVSPSLHASMSSGGLYPGTGSIYSSTSQISSSVLGPYGGYDSTSNGPPANHTFERIQFQRATANNGKRRAQQQYFQVVVELSADIGRASGAEDWVLIATRESEPVVVRGRSPGHYKDNQRRDSQTSMDPDRGNGSGEGSQATIPVNHYGHPNTDWHQNSHRHGAGDSYGNRGYRHATKPIYTPTQTASPSDLITDLAEADLVLSDSHTAKSSCTFSSEQSALTPLSDASDDILFNMDHTDAGRKRSYEEEDDDDAEKEDYLRYQHGAPFTDNTGALTDLSLMSYSKLLCASS